MWRACVPRRDPSWSAGRRFLHALLVGPSCPQRHQDGVRIARRHWTVARYYYSSTFCSSAATTERHSHRHTEKSDTDPFDKLHKKGAWVVLAALEKAREAQGVKLAQLINGLETLLPRDHASFDAYIQGLQQQHLASAELLGHTTDPAFFSLPPETLDRLEVGALTSHHVRDMFQATRQGRRLALETCEALMRAATAHFRAQPPVVRLPALLQQQNQQLTVVGDLHGSLSDLEAVLGLTGEPNQHNLIVFNGDLADRGDHGLEVIIVVCALVLTYPQYVFVNRGNHEDLALSFAYGLSQEVKHKYGPGSFRKRLAPQLDGLFRVLPVATVIEDDAAIVHAGPPPPGTSLHDVPRVIQPNRRGLSRTIKTYQEVDDNHLRGHELLEALVWSDPILVEDQNNTNGSLLAERTLPVHDHLHLHWKPNRSRGAGHQYSAGIVRNFLQAEGLHRLIRSHEPVHAGCVRYEIARHIDDNNTQPCSSDHPLEFFTVFSASRYPHKEGFNQGAILVLQPEGRHKILRYATEEDEPKRPQTEEIPINQLDEESIMLPDVSVASVRKALQKAAASYHSELTRALEALDEHYVTGIPFDEVVDVLIQTLKLDDDPLLHKPEARLVLAKAMLETDWHDTTPPETIDAMACLDALIQDEQEQQSEYLPQELAPYYPWLRAVFETVDVDHDGILSKEDWMRAVEAMNANLTAGTTRIHAEDLWELLDVNGDGHVSVQEWDQLNKALTI